ncbi:antibiotic ABC transporter permease [Halobacteriales archaeon QS_1_68_20]|nr:MAG: antibiotic ABC transporter permease [Halobacteriales archaeon QS_1_68_20]
MTAGQSSEFGGPSTDEAATVLERTLAYARRREYTGWDYGDGMSSRFRRALPFDNRWVNLAFQETAKRAPINVRPLLLVERRRNFMGAALFVLANLRAADLFGDDAYRAEARRLADWLVAHRTEGYSGYCGGHNHDLQGLRKRTPGVVGTTFAVEALLAAGDAFDERYAEVALTAADFVFEDLGYEERGDRATIDYKPDEPGAYVTINAVALGARLLVDLYDYFGDRRCLDGARKLLNYVADLQTDAGGWYYREPPEATHLSMDTHHNGFVIECFQRYRAVVDDRYDETLDRALAFFRDELFEVDGAPNFDEDSAYPRDVHASVQGVLAFTKAGDLEFARRILGWTLARLYAGDGRFYVRQHRLYTQRHVLMRWCQAWMAHALAEYLTARERGGDHVALPERTP